MRRTVTLPCEIDDILYYKSKRGEIMPLKVRLFWIGRFAHQTATRDLMIRTDQFDFPAICLGRTVFCTHEEAEAATKTL